jgi:solute carrier family 6 amino acid transporter-like protein 5/7/9/14
VRVLEVQPLQVMPVERQRWANNVEFLLSSLAYAVGFGTMWRFPYFAYRYGGGSFLIAFTFFLVIIAVPLYVLEAGELVRPFS